MENKEYTEEEKIEVIKDCIKTMDGWRIMAMSLENDMNKRDKCAVLLRKVAACTDVELPPEMGEVISSLEDFLVAKLDEQITKENTQ